MQAGVRTNEEREQTLNQLLSEMDGFTPDSGACGCSGVLPEQAWAQARRGRLPATGCLPCFSACCPPLPPSLPPSTFPSPPHLLQASSLWRPRTAPTCSTRRSCAPVRPHAAGLAGCQLLLPACCRRRLALWTLARHALTLNTGSPLALSLAAGRFDRKIRILRPDEQGRAEVLQARSARLGGAAALMAAVGSAGSAWQRALAPSVCPRACTPALTPSPFPPPPADPRPQAQDGGRRRPHAAGQGPARAVR